MAGALDALHQLAASASEVHAAIQRQPVANNKVQQSGKLRVDMKSDEDRVRKRQLRLLKNRQSAALSRQRKKEYINDLESKAGNLNVDKSDLEYKVTKLTSMTLDYKVQVDRLEKQLQETNQENLELRMKLSAMESASQATASSSAAPATHGANSCGFSLAPLSSIHSSMRLLHPPPTLSSSSAASRQSYPSTPAYPPPVHE